MIREEFDGARRLATHTSLIERQHELLLLAQLLRQPETRLVTLSGPPGAGKSRLLAELYLREQQTEGTEFSLLFGDASKAREIASSIGNTDVPGKPARTLVVLDDDGAPLGELREAVTTLLASRPHVVLLLASRARLLLGMERVVELAPLRVEARDEGEIAPAVRLFLERARDASGLEVRDESTMREVQAIARDLDGLPLAIELAAARTSVLSPREIRERLSDPLSFLTAEGRSLRASIARSWSTLTEENRSALAVCAAFQGPFSSDRAEVALRAFGIEDSLAQLQTLREHSLLESHDTVHGERRLRLYDTVRAFVTEAADASVREAAHRAMGRACANLAENVLAHAYGPRSADSMRRLVSEEKQLEAFLQCIAEDTGDELLSSAAWTGAALLHLRQDEAPSAAFFSTIETLLTQMKGREERLDPQAVIAFHARAAVVKSACGHEGSAERLASSAITRARAAQSPRSEGLSLLSAASCARRAGKRATFHEWIARALEVAERTADTVVAALSHHAIAAEGEMVSQASSAISSIERAIQLARQCQDPLLEMRATLLHAELLAGAGSWLTAHRLAMQVRTTSQALGDERSLAAASVVAGGALIELGRGEEANALLDESVLLARRAKATRSLGCALVFMGIARAERGDWTGAHATFAQAVDELDRQRDPIEYALAQTAYGVVTALLGRHAEGERLVAMMLDEASDSQKVVAHVIATGLDVAGQRLDEAKKVIEDHRRQFARTVTELMVPGLLLRLSLRFADDVLSSYAPEDGALVLADRSKQVRLPDGAVRSFHDKPMLWRLACAIAKLQLRSPDGYVKRSDLVSEVWAAEKISGKAASNRLAVAIHKLRKDGFSPLVEVSPRGVRLRPGTRVVWARSFSRLTMSAPFTHD